MSACELMTSFVPFACSKITAAYGKYRVIEDGWSHANGFKVYCEMDTDIGGWNLVWSWCCGAAGGGCGGGSEDGGGGGGGGGECGGGGGAGRSGETGLQNLLPART